MSWNDDQCDDCSKPWTVHLLMGCVHEHMGEVRLCVSHEYYLFQGMYCTPCINDHPCLVSTVKNLAVVDVFT